jgi:hypothetical protein
MPGTTPELIAAAADRIERALDSCEDTTAAVEHLIPSHGDGAALTERLALEGIPKDQRRAVRGAPRLEPACRGPGPGRGTSARWSPAGRRGRPTAQVFRAAAAVPGARSLYPTPRSAQDFRGFPPGQNFRASGTGASSPLPPRSTGAGLAVGPTRTSHFDGPVLPPGGECP